PAEVAADAAADPVVQQKLLSKDPLDMPYKAPAEAAGETEAVGGKPPAEPPKPPAEPPEAPPPAGSLEEARAHVHSRISVGEREPRRPLTFDRLYTELIDDLHPIKAVGEDAYQMARLTRGQFGKAEYFLERGTFDFDTFANTGKPLKEILAPVRSDLGGLRDFLSARRAVELEESGRKSGFEVDKARMVVEADQGKYGKIADELVTYQNNLLKYLKDSGVVSEGSFDAMVEANKNYVPFYRLIVPEQTPAAAGSKFGPGNPIHKLKGSEREIIDPLESII